jgi:hypothetical protein
MTIDKRKSGSELASSENSYAVALGEFSAVSPESGRLGRTGIATELSQNSYAGALGEFSAVSPACPGVLTITGYDGAGYFGDSSLFDYSEDLDVIFRGNTTVAPNSTVSAIHWRAGEVVGRFGFNPSFRNDGDLPIGVNVGTMPSFEVLGSCDSCSHGG